MEYSVHVCQPRREEEEVTDASENAKNSFVQAAVAYALVFCRDTGGRLLLPLLVVAVYVVLVVAIVVVVVAVVVVIVVVVVVSPVAVVLVLTHMPAKLASTACCLCSCSVGQSLKDVAYTFQVL